MKTIHNEQLNSIEKTIIIEIISYLENDNNHFFSRSSSLLKKYIKQSSLGKYKLQYLDIDTINEILLPLDSQVVERIFIHCYILLCEWGREDKIDDLVLNNIFTSINEYEIEQMKDKVHRYINNEISIEQLLPEKNSNSLKASTTLRAIKLFEYFKSNNYKKINEAKLKKLNKGALIKVWVTVNKHLEIAKNPNTPKHIKVIAISALLYVITPIDAIPDVIPIGGLVDDAAIVLLALDQIKNLLKK